MKLTLYQFEHCPYCAKVRAKLEELGLDYEKVNVAQNREDPQRKEIAQKSGVLTVPVLHAGEKWIGESEHIIEFLENIQH